MSDEMREAQLKALRATLAAAVHQVDALIARPEGAPCDHPQSKRKDRSTMGEPRFICTQCGEIVEGEAG